MLLEAQTLIPEPASSLYPRPGASIALTEGGADGAHASPLFGPELYELTTQLENLAAENGARTDLLGEPAVPLASRDSVGPEKVTHPSLTNYTTVADPVDSAMLEQDMLKLDGAAMVVFLVLILLALWSSVTFAASRRGWASFASARSTVSEPPGRRYRAAEASFGGLLGSYRNVVLVTFCSAGMHFRAPWTFRPFHRPFLVPWSSVKAVRRKSARQPSRYRIEIEDAAGKILLRLSGNVAVELRASQASREF